MTKLAKNCSKGLKGNGKEIDQMKMEIAECHKQNKELKERIEEKKFEEGVLEHFLDNFIKLLFLLGTNFGIQWKI
jgi:hypothetical protein